MRGFRGWLVVGLVLCGVLSASAGTPEARGGQVIATFQDEVTAGELTRGGETYSLAGEMLQGRIRISPEGVLDYLSGDAATFPLRLDARGLVPGVAFFGVSFYVDNPRIWRQIHELSYVPGESLTIDLGFGFDYINPEQVPSSSSYRLRLEGLLAPHPWLPGREILQGSYALSVDLERTSNPRWWEVSGQTSLTPIPEPATLASGALAGLLGLGWGAGRRRRASTSGS